MDKLERIKLIKAMEFIARHTNSENVFNYWLRYGVADGDILYGDLDSIDNNYDEYLLDSYANDDDFCELMNDFIYLIDMARNDGGLYCDGIKS